MLQQLHVLGPASDTFDAGVELGIDLAPEKRHVQ
jgi:hypothetical protein